jgi:hypothetical protein
MIDHQEKEIKDLINQCDINIDGPITRNSFEIKSSFGDTNLISLKSLPAFGSNTSGLSDQKLLDKSSKNSQVNSKKNSISR